MPKGKIENGETLQETALRELKEEAGISATFIPGFEQTIHYIFSNKEGQLVTKTATFFLGQASEKSITLSHEHADFKWLPLEEAVKLVTYENARQLLELAEHACHGILHSYCYSSFFQHNHNLALLLG